MNKYIVTYNGFSNTNTCLVSTQVAIDIDMNNNLAAQFLTILEDNALVHAQELDGNVTRVSVVGIYKL
ncbi:hypothetical protein [Xenorhabdus innexi]|uniref:Uncharacterized protein n=1 Tax=Xenorhabdus innexi TaxID=290109 RepID=A0A1N6MWE9_9GAMM|nr:hypothetical protein [Xenorhabdus innexi]PHM36603.1 hypothetical protein Xinn_01546 [Xenorhabdus innexi]SIP73150.1 hypothetical protein XIS1_1750042 [Xenorhabdus innexi]